MCPIGCPICIPIQLLALYTLLLTLGLTSQNALIICGIVGIGLVYISYKVIIKLYYKFKAYKNEHKKP